jgi:hypothetical protein
MSVIEDVHARIRDYLAVVPGITKAEYPAPNSLSANNTAVVYAGDFDITHSDEMYLAGVSRAVLYIAPTDTPVALGKADGLALDVVDQFAPNHPGFHLDGLVDFCQVSRVELSRVVSYAGHDYFGAIFYFRLKIRRFAGAGFVA